MKALNAIRLSGREVLPLIEGGKGIGVTNGLSSGAWAAAGGVGTFSGVNADSYDETAGPFRRPIAVARARSATRSSSTTRSGAASPRPGSPTTSPAARAGST